jgi:gamma-glutamyl-gamma-aminobutyrate hydrolase PuuD
VTGAPVVGITSGVDRARHGLWDREVVLLTRTYVDAVAAAGGVPVVLPPLPGVEAAALRCDAVLLSGGGDVDARRYAAAVHPRTEPPRPARDAAELAVLDAALAAGRPVLGVCRGLQLLNVALGGTLHQHLPDVVGHTGHNPVPGEFTTVQVAVAPGSRVAGVLGAERVGVRCHHHQGIDRVAPGLTVSARAGDGTVEAVERAGDPFVVAVQWHPEEHLATDRGADLRLVSALVDAAR